jgi:septal ring factor EnvC (AmiA/AmiB activator)
LTAKQQKQLAKENAALRKELGETEKMLKTAQDRTTGFYDQVSSLVNTCERRTEACRELAKDLEAAQRENARLTAELRKEVATRHAMANGMAIERDELLLRAEVLGRRMGDLGLEVED